MKINEISILKHINNGKAIGAMDTPFNGISIIVLGLLVILLYVHPI